MRVILFILLIPSAAMAFGALCAAFSSEFWRVIRAPLDVFVFLMLMAPCMAISYTLFVNPNHLILVLIAFVAQATTTTLWLNRGIRLESAPQDVTGDTRRPVLFLRSFRRETNRAAAIGHLIRYLQKFRFAVDHARKLKSEGKFTSIEAMRERQFLFLPILYDEQIILSDLLSNVGPYVAIARPSRFKPRLGVGASKIKVPDNKWQEVVTNLIVESVMIVIEGGESTGLLWELSRVIEFAQPTKVLLIVGRSDRQYERFRHATAKIFPVPLPKNRPQSRLLTFTETWRAVLLESENSRVTNAEMRPGDLYDKELLASVLRPFLVHNGYDPADEFNSAAAAGS